MGRASNRMCRKPARLADAISGRIRKKFPRHASKWLQSKLNTNKRTADRILAGNPPAWAITELLSLLEPELWAEMLARFNDKLEARVTEREETLQRIKAGNPSDCEAGGD